LILPLAGLITQRGESRQLLYSVDFSVMNGLVAYLTENCCGNNSAECAVSCAPHAYSRPHLIRLLLRWCDLSLLP
jgi:hypothetical protein